WTAGAYGSVSLERTPSTLDVLSGSVVLTSSAALTGARLTNVYNEERRDHLHELAVYGEGVWRLSPGWTISAGARAFSTHLQVTSRIQGAPPTTPRNIDESTTFSGLSPKLSLQYEFMDGQLVYGLYSEGFRSGGVNTTNFLTIRAQRTTFEPDRLQNFE